MRENNLGRWVQFACGIGVLLCCLSLPLSAAEGDGLEFWEAESKANPAQPLPFDGGRITLRWGGKNPGGGRLYAPKSLRLHEGEDAVFRIASYRENGKRSWGCLMLLVLDDKGVGSGFVVNGSGKAGLCQRAPEFQSRGYDLNFVAGDEFVIRCREKKLEMIAPGYRNLCEYEMPVGPEGLRLALEYGVGNGNDEREAELAGVAIRPIPCAAQLPPLPPERFPRLVLSHSMVCVPPVGDFADFLTRNYENASLMPALSAKEGGFQGRFFRDLQNAGIDAVAYCWFDNMRGHDFLIDRAEDAAKSGTKIRTLACQDNMPKDGRTFPRLYWEDQRLREHPGILSVEGRPVLITYAHHGAEEWRERLKLLEAVGGRLVAITDTSCIEVAVGKQFLVGDRFRTTVEQLDGVYFFGSSGVALPPVGIGLVPSFMDYWRKLPQRKIVGVSVSTGYIGSTRSGNVFSPRGTLHFRLNWMDAIKYNPDFVNLTTNNDYSEATEQECSINDTYSYIDMNRYFGQRWRTGVWPKLDQPQAFLSYRKGINAAEPVQMELVLLVPEIDGSEDPVALAKRYQAQCAVSVNGKRTLRMPDAPLEVWPGHLVWRFWHYDGVQEAGWAVPEARVTVDGQQLELAKGPLAPFAVVGDSEWMARKWLRVPLHRVPAIQARVVVTGCPGERYPRTLRVEGIPAEKIAGGRFERTQQTISLLLTPQELCNGWIEHAEFPTGYAPMEYKDGWTKRNVIDKHDRYTAVVRLNDDTFVFPQPVVMEAPRPDPATVFDAVICPGEKMLVDRGPMRRDLPLPEPESGACPQIAQDVPGTPWFLRFDGKDDKLETNRYGYFVPPGAATLEMWIRLQEGGRAQTFFDSWGAAFSVGVSDAGTLNLFRVDHTRQGVWQKGTRPVSTGIWHHVVATFTGRYLQLYLDGQPDGAPVESYGVRTDERSIIGSGQAMLPALTGRHDQNAFFHGDLGWFRILQRSLSKEEIAAQYRANAPQFGR